MNWRHSIDHFTSHHPAVQRGAIHPVSRSEQGTEIPAVDDTLTPRVIDATTNNDHVANSGTILSRLILSSRKPR
jgi:hypothetical protein